MKPFKNVYLLVKDCGDGSYSITYVFDEEALELLEMAYEDGKMDYDHPGCDGDGFSYQPIRIPVDWTHEDMGIPEYSIFSLAEVKAAYYEEGND